MVHLLIDFMACILVISDFAPDVNGFGGTQTAYNLLRLLGSYQQKVLVNNDFRSSIHEPYRNNKNVLFHTGLIHGRLQNRFYPIFNWVKELFNTHIHIEKKEVANFLDVYYPAIILGITKTAPSFYFAYWYKKKYPAAKLIFFVMDDYQFYKRNWLKNRMNQIFSATDGMVYIGEQMAAIHQKQYVALQNKSFKTIINPVNLQHFHLLEFKIEPVLQLVYAGSVYPNHQDGLYLLLRWLKKTHLSVRLTIFTKDIFWQELGQTEHERLAYGGELSYSQLLEELPKYSLGIITESFTEQFRYIAESSVQTKLNDYLLKGVTPLVIGPVYGATGNYVDNHQLGYRYSTQSIEGLEEFMASFIELNKEQVSIPFQDNWKKLYGQQQKELLEWIERMIA